MAFEPPYPAFNTQFQKCPWREAAARNSEPMCGRLLSILHQQRHTAVQLSISADIRPAARAVQGSPPVV